MRREVFNVRRRRARRPTSPTKHSLLRTQWQGRSETIGEYGRHMESVAEVPEEAIAGSVSPVLDQSFPSSR